MEVFTVDYGGMHSRLLSKEDVVDWINSIDWKGFRAEMRVEGVGVYIYAYKEGATYPPQLVGLWKELLPGEFIVRVGDFLPDGGTRVDSDLFNTVHGNYFFVDVRGDGFDNRWGTVETFLTTQSGTKGITTYMFIDRESAQKFCDSL